MGKKKRERKGKGKEGGLRSGIGTTTVWAETK
jgi:hypothetical protein